MLIFTFLQLDTGFDENNSEDNIFDNCNSGLENNTILEKNIKKFVSFVPNERYNKQRIN